MSTKYHLYIHTPTPIFKARVNLPGVINYPLTELPYNRVTLGAYTDIQPFMTLLVGSTEGADDLGRVRVKYLADADSISLPRTARGIEDGTLDVRNGSYITVLEDWRIWAKIPYFDMGLLLDSSPGSDYKDGDIAAGDYNTEIPPVANTGPAMAGYIDSVSGLLTVTFPGGGSNLSYTMADGATITSYTWEVGDGTITVGSASDPVITATFPAGFRWVKLNILDSNGKGHTAWCPVLAIDPDDDPTVQEFSANQRLEAKGQTLDIQLYKPLDRTDYPDGTLVLFWWDEPSSPSDRSHMKFVGWLDKETYQVGRRREGLTKATSLHCIDVAGRLNLLPGFPQALEREESDSLWSWMPSLDMSKSLFYLLYWHSTALDVVDFFLPQGGTDYDAMRLDASGATLFDQVDSQAQKMVPDHYLTCNSMGQLRVQRDWMLDDVGDRPASAPILTEDKYTDFGFDYNRHPKVHCLRSAAIQSSTDFIVVDGEDTLPLVFSIAPGEAASFSQGTTEASENEGLALSQADLNKSEGHRYALLNSRYGKFTFSDPSGEEFWDYEPALFARVQLNLAAAYAAYRDLDFTQLIGRVQDITVTYKTSKIGTSLTVNATLQREEIGTAALTYNPETGEVTPNPYVPLPETETPGLRSGVEEVAAILSGPLAGGYSLYRTADFQTPSGDGGPTWEAVLIDDVTDTLLYSFVVDPFSPGYRGTGSAINGWVVGDTAIWRIEDMFGTASASSVHTFAVTLPAAGWRTIQASFGRFFETESDNPWLLCISYYHDTGGHTGTWATRSVDGGQTWSEEVLVSSFYDSGSSARKPIGVYTSPKTPGLAYTAAFITTDALPVGSGFMSTDWGATWTALDELPPEDPDEPRTLFGVLRVIGSPPDTLLNSYYANGVTYAQTSQANGGPPSVIDSKDYRILVAPPANAKRIVISGHITAQAACGWDHGTIPVAQINVSPGASTKSGGMSMVEDIDVNEVVNQNESTSVSQNFTVTWTRGVSATDFPGNRDQLLAEAPNINYSGYNRLRVFTYGGTSAALSSAFAQISINFTITEVELEDGTIYVPQPVPALLDPGRSQAGDIHLPWPNNDSESVFYHGAVEMDSTLKYRLKRIVDGAAADISPIAAGVSYGVSQYGFAIRTHDNDRSYVAVGATGNDSDGSPATNKYGAWVSDDEGDTWSNIIAPLASTNFLGLHGFSLAFGADDPDILFVWGPLRSSATGLIQYSTNRGTALDNREGDMGTGESGSWALIGIAGGPLT